MHCLLLNRVPQETVQDVIAANTHGISSQAHHGTCPSSATRRPFMWLYRSGSRKRAAVLFRRTPAFDQNLLCGFHCAAVLHLRILCFLNDGLSESERHMPVATGCPVIQQGKKEESTQNPQRNTTLSNGLLQLLDLGLGPQL